MESEDVKLLEHILEGSIKPTDIKLSALESITQNFSEERKIGQGGFGTVYKGVLRNGEVAVKRIRNDQTIDEKLFQREVSSLLNVSHQNIVRFIGFCSHTVHKALDYEGRYIYAENRDRIICFEYINNGSLEKYIADELRGLPWDTRYFIIKGICEGVQYLHMKKHIIHMDLKPANILIDNNMVAKITDFGMSRLEKNTETKSTSRFSSQGYTAPEYIDYGKMTVKNDVYSLGVIIIELVTGHRSIPDSNNVLRRWRHRLHKSGKEAPFRYQQIAKLIEIGLLCQEKDPYKRPFIYDIINVINELESTDRTISNAAESIGKISAYLEDDMLGIEPLELHFPFVPNNQISCSIELTNETKAFIAFSIKTTSPLPYCIQPNKDIVAPRSKYNVKITLQPLDKAPQDRKYTGNFIVRSTKVSESLISQNITEDTFNREDGKLVDEVNLSITYKAEVPEVDISYGSLIISDSRNLHGPRKSNVPSTEAESKASPCTSNELIQFDPPELSLPFMPNKLLVFCFNIVNNTDYSVGFNKYIRAENTGLYYIRPAGGVMAPRSTQRLVVKRIPKEREQEDIQCEDKFFLWSSIVSEGVEASDIVGYVNDYEGSKELPIVYKKSSLCTSDELIKFDPPQLPFPFLPNRRVPMLCLFKIVNVTDQSVGFKIWPHVDNFASYKVEPSRSGILLPQSKQTIKVRRTLKENEKESEDMHCKDKILVWNGIVTEGVQASDVDRYWKNDDKEFPVVLTKASPCTSNELIMFDPPELSLPFIPNKNLVFSVNIVNNTDYSVGFNKYIRTRNSGRYYLRPEGGVMPPRSTQRLVVKRIPKEKDQEDMLCEDKFFLRSSIVSEGVEASDIVDYNNDYEGIKKLPIVYKKTSLCTSDELIQLDPPQLAFPFRPNRRVAMLCLLKIVNVTDHNVGFQIWSHGDNFASYILEPPAGILLPQSTQTIEVRRTLKANEKESEDMQCKDRILVWNGIVTAGVQISDVLKYWKNDDKELPVVLTKENPCTSDELIQFDPPDLSLPFIPNKKLVFSVNIVNNTDYSVGFKKYFRRINTSWYSIRPDGGVMPPRSTQRLIVKRKPKKNEQKDMLCEDKFFLWNTIVSEGVEASDIADYEWIKELPIVYKKSSLCTSDELIQFDPPQLPFPVPLPSNEGVPMLRLFKEMFKIVNVTDHIVGFSIWSHQDNYVRYKVEPDAGILSPRSTQGIKVRRTLKATQSEDMQCKDKIFVWNGIVTEGVETSDVAKYWKEDDKELPVVLTECGESSSR